MKGISPIGYPGGKASSVDFIFATSRLPKAPIREYREPFLGGGSCALHFSKLHPNVPVWVNDLHYPVYCFWKILRERPMEMHGRIMEENKKLEYVISKLPPIRAEYFKWPAEKRMELMEPFKKLYQRCYDEMYDSNNPFEIAWRYFIVNKLSFGALATSRSSFSSAGPVWNFIHNIIHSLPSFVRYMKNWRITNLDYRQMLKTNDDVFVFFDPPYDLKENYSMNGTNGNILYGQNGEMHATFSNDDFLSEMQKFKTPAMITYNSEPKIKSTLADWKMEEWDKIYRLRLNNESYRQAQKERKEILLWNYEEKGEASLGNLL